MSPWCRGSTPRSIRVLPALGTFPATNSQLSAYHFTELPTSKLTASGLAPYDTVILYGIRWNTISASGQAALNTFAATHKVMIWDADGTGAQDYSTFIQPFSTLASNASGQPKDSVVTYPAGNDPNGNDFLASSNPSSPYYLDPSQLVSDPSMINDMNAMKTGTKNWLPGLVAENKNIPQGGWPLAWSYGVINNRTGLTIYSGLDADAIDNSQLNPNDEITELALELKAPFSMTPQPCGPTCTWPPTTAGPPRRRPSTAALPSTVPSHWVHGRVSIWLTCSPADRHQGQGAADALRADPRLARGAERSDPPSSTDATDADEPHLPPGGRLWQQSTDQEHVLPTQGRQHSAAIALPPDEQHWERPPPVVPGQRKSADADRGRWAELPEMGLGRPPQVDPGDAPRQCEPRTAHRPRPCRQHRRAQARLVTSSSDRDDKTGARSRERVPPSPSSQQEPSSYLNDPMTRLWQNAQDRDTGAEAVEAIRARRRSLGPQEQNRR